VGHTFTRLLYHAIWSTKDRRPEIDEELQPRLFPYLGGIVKELGGKALSVGGMSDHVHMLMSLPATVAVADALRVVKTNSSRWVHETWPERRRFAWQTGYGAFTVSNSNQETVEGYIARQEAHHRRKTFQEEFLAFLKKHGLEYDERFIWE
jgi:REP element-mobilizing transposase RayT